MTGHVDKDGREPDWRALGQPGMTAVFYMGLARLEHIAARLVEHGASPNLPAALIAQGTLSDQRVIKGSLSTLPGLTKHSCVQSPALLVIGEVVSLHDSLAWFNSAVPIEASRSA